MFFFLLYKCILYIIYYVFNIILFKILWNIYICIYTSVNTYAIPFVYIYFLNMHDIILVYDNILMLLN